MRWVLVPLTLCWVAASGSFGGPVDYSKVDRTIKAEPTYQSKSPQYALLLFGREATIRVWMVLDGEAVYVDRNRDGDLTGEGERFPKHADCKDIQIADPDGQTRYVITSVGAFTDGKPAKTQLMVDVDVRGPINYRQYCDVAVTQSPRKAPLAHFHGPLTMGPVTVRWKLPPKLALVSGEKPVDLPGVVGTMDEEHGCWVVVRSHEGEKGAFPKGATPVVDVEFPPKTPGGATIKRRYPLAEFC